MRQIGLIDDFVGSFCSLHLALEEYWTNGRDWLNAEDFCKEKYLATYVTKPTYFESAGHPGTSREFLLTLPV
jgi:hypothetical protein